jgi:NADPH2:quinone reductase
MQSYWMQQTDTASVLELRDIPVPTPGPGQLLMRVGAASLNRGEFVLGHGLHGAPGTWKAIGMEAAGEIAAAGPGAGKFKTGDRVMGRCAGAFAEYALVDQDEVMPVPAGLSLEEASGIPLAFLVTFDMLVEQGRLKSGEWLLVNGVSSGVGVACLQLGKALGAKVIGTSGSREKLDLLKGLGLDAGIQTRKPDFAARVLELTGGQGANLAVNTVGGSMFAENVECLAFEGRQAIVGYVDGVLDARFDLQAVHAKRLAIFGVSNKKRSKAQRAASIPAFTEQVLPFFASGRIRPQIDAVMNFSQLAQAKARMEAGEHTGKIVLRVSAGNHA